MDLRILVESHAENAENLAAKIDKALERGLPVDMHVVVRDPVESYRSVVGRYERAEAKRAGSGKVVPVNYGAATHEAVTRNVPKLMEWYVDDPLVGWHFIGNKGMPKEAREVGPEEGFGSWPRLIPRICATSLTRFWTMPSSPGETENDLGISRFLLSLNPDEQARR
jgi:hypothetical protein